LVVHDTDDERALTTLVLTQVGASVAAVPSAREALELLERERPRNRTGNLTHHQRNSVAGPPAALGDRAIWYSVC
jgi:CheY-like chemotaxis protein